eukprot:517434_1
MKAMKQSEIILAESFQDELNANNKIENEMKDASNKLNENYNREINNIGKDMQNVLNEYDSKQEALMNELNDLTAQVNEMNSQIKQVRISEQELLQRYKMYKYGAKNMKDNGDKISAVKYLRQSKLIAQQIETVKNGAVVLKIDVPPVLDDMLWKQ